jgi:hypothetical protein
MNNNKIINLTTPVNSSDAATKAYVDSQTDSLWSIAFPDGLSGITPTTINNLSSTPYAVPSGKNLYIANVRISDNYELKVAGKTIAYVYFNRGA